MKRKKLYLLFAIMGLSLLTVFGCSSKDTQTTSTEVTEDAEYMKDPDATPPEEIQGEGMADEAVPDIANTTSANLNQEFVVPAESGAEFCTITVTSVETTDERDENNASNPQNVLVINYTYRNASPDDLLIDDMSFKLLENSKTCQPYYGAFLKAAEPAAPGASASGQVAFEISADFKSGTLVFSHSMAGEEISFDIAL